MKSNMGVVSFILLLTIAAGCSQRSGQLTDHQVTRNVVQLGDTAEYSRSATTGTPLSSRGTGHTTVTVVTGDHHRRAVSSHIVKTYHVQSKTTQQSGGRQQSYTTIMWYGEDRSGNLYLLGQSLDGTNWAYVMGANPPLIMSTDLRIGKSWKYTANFSDGTMEAVSLECVGVEKLVIPIGQYEAYKVRRVGRHSGVGGDFSGYVWLSLNLPLVFELKGQNTIQSRVHGISISGETEYTLEKLTLAH